MGVESAYELADKGYNVTFLDQAFSVLPLFLDEEMSDKLLDLNDGIDFEINVNVEGIVNNDLKKEIHYNGKTITADAVILSAGRIPSTLLAEKAGCEIGEYGVVIDKYLETNVDDIYAIGDCVEVESHITGGQTVSPAGTSARDATVRRPFAPRRSSSASLWTMAPRECRWSAPPRKRSAREMARMTPPQKPEPGSMSTVTISGTGPRKGGTCPG